MKTSDSKQTEASFLIFYLQNSQVGFSEWNTSELTAVPFLSTGRHSWKQT